MRIEFIVSSDPPGFRGRFVLDPYQPGVGTQCEAGCTGNEPKDSPFVPLSQGCMCEWYSNFTHIEGNATLPSALRTYQNIAGFVDWTKANPWRAPGTAKVFSPCGIDGGNPGGCPVGNADGGGCAGGGYGHGPDSRAIDFVDVVTTEWKAGEVVKVGWGVQANHGGTASLGFFELSHC